MRAAVVVAAALVATTAVAQQGVAGGGLRGPGGSSTSGSSSSANNVTATPGTGLQSYFVDGTSGSDSNACTASGASACLTIQGALNKVPELLRDQVTINIAAGNYAGFIVSGFIVDNGVQQATGGLLIDGALATSTIATGSATGTATAGSAGSGSTFGTLTDSGATWTVNDLVGRFITTATPTNATFVISSNTATVITVEGAWSAPTGATTYTIQDPSVIIAGASNGASLPATPLAAVSTNNTGILIFGNNLSYRSNAIVLRNMRVASTNTALTEVGASAIQLTQMQFRPSAGTASGIAYNSSTSFIATGALSVVKCDISLSSSGSGIATSGGVITATNSLFRNATANGIGIQLGALNSSFGRLTNFSNNEITGFTSGIVSICGTSYGSQLTGNRITCAASGSNRLGIAVGSTTTNIAQCASTFSPVTNFNISTCDTALQVVGPASADVASMTGSVGATGFATSLGGIISFAKAGTTITAGTNEVSEDSGGATSTFAGIAAGTCLATMGFGSRVCGR